MNQRILVSTSALLTLAFALLPEAKANCVEGDYCSKFGKHVSNFPSVSSSTQVYFGYTTGSSNCGTGVSTCLAMCKVTSGGTATLVVAKDESNQKIAMRAFGALLDNVSACGTNSANWIGGGRWGCGGGSTVFGPLWLNGHYFQVSGLGGDDVISNLAVADDGGPDTGKAEYCGGTGEDWLYDDVEEVRSLMYGQENDDVLEGSYFDSGDQLDYASGSSGEDILYGFYQCRGGDGVDICDECHQMLSCNE